MKVLSVAADTGGCGFYRMRAPAEELVKLGVDVTVSDGVDATATMDSRGMVTVTEVQSDADLLVIQRPLDNGLTSLIEQAKRQGIATIVELDDDFSTVARGNIAYDLMYKYAHTGNKWVEKAASVADHVTVSTTQLTKYAPHGRVSVLRNCVPDSIFSIGYDKPERDKPVVGWTGSVQTHPNDLQMTRGGVAEALKSTGTPFAVVGDGKHVRDRLRLHPDTPFKFSGWVDVDKFYEHVVSMIDIGIVPLEPSAFNDAKSYLKGLEFAALGIPFVASPVREYELLAVYGIGRTAKTPGEWRKHLTRMIERTSETERIARESQDTIKSEFTYSKNAPKWLEAWEKAIAHRKSSLN